jgi:hypothetical protein
MGELLYFVKRRDGDGSVVNTICRTAEDALRKLIKLRSEGHPGAWIEDGDGKVISDKATRE